MSPVAYCTDKKSREVKAMLILEQHLGIKGLKISDSPDITDNASIGIEVVQTNELDFLRDVAKQEISYVESGNLSDLPDREYECEVYVSEEKEAVVEKKLFELYLAKYREKLHKLNDHYTIFLENDLFMFGNMMHLEDNELKLLLQFFKSENNNYERTVDKVFVYEDGRLFEMNLKERKIAIINVDDFKVEDKVLGIYERNE